MMRARLAAAVVVLAWLAGSGASGFADDLRVCADPNNLPFSDESEGGFENKIADVLARELGKSKVSYTWWAQRRGFVRNTLKARECDVIIGVPAGYDLVETTRPYYRSTYVFVSRADRHLDVASLEDERLSRLAIGVHLIGDDGMNTPPAHVLGDRGLVANVRGFMIYGDYREPSPPARLIEAVEKGEIDLAAAWGPLAGYAAKNSLVPLRIVPIEGTEKYRPLRFAFDIAAGVRKGDHALKEKLDAAIVGRQSEITAILAAYGVPVIAPPQQSKAD